MTFMTEIITKLRLEDKSGQIYNYDETSFCHDLSKTNIVGAMGVSCQRQLVLHICINLLFS